MKKCPHCGTTNFDVAVNCEKCNLPINIGQPSSKNYSVEETNRTYSNVTFQNNSSPKKTNCALAAQIFLYIDLFLSVAAFAVSFVLWIVGCIIIDVVLTLWGFISMVVFIPLTLLIALVIHKYNKCLRYNVKPSVAFQVLVLLFINTIAGILMLVDNN